VKLICLYGKINGLNDYEIIGGTYERISILNYFHSIFSLAKYIIKNDINIIISFLPLANILNGLLGRLLGVNKIIVSHRNPVWTYSLPMRIIDRFLGGVGFYDYVVSNSISVQKSYLQYSLNYVKNSIVINNSVKTAKEELNKEQVFLKYNIDSENKLLVAIGRLTHQKRFDLLIEMMSFVDNADLVIGGSGEDEDLLQSLAKKNPHIHFLGHLDQPEVINLMTASDVYLQPSEFEGQSNSLLEALSCGCTIVSSSIEAQTEVLIDGNEYSGLIVDNFEVSCWAKAVNELLDNDQLRTELSQFAKMNAENYTLEKTAKKYMKLIKNDIKKEATK
jgi:glycosyltransferase involved in cell wall biosynthesis